MGDAERIRLNRINVPWIDLCISGGIRGYAKRCDARVRCVYSVPSVAPPISSSGGLLQREEGAVVNVW